VASEKKEEEGAEEKKWIKNSVFIDSKWYGVSRLSHLSSRARPETVLWKQKTELTLWSIETFHSITSFSVSLISLTVSVSHARQ
jgi:hypothetical protein